MHQVTPLLFAPPPLGLDLHHRASVMQFVLYKGDINDFAVVHNYEVITKQSLSGGLDPRWSGNQCQRPQGGCVSFERFYYCIFSYQ